MADIIEEVKTEIFGTFNKFKEKQKYDLINAANGIACQCKHTSRIALVEERIMWFKRMSWLYQILLFVLSILLMLIFCGFWLLRQYNISNIFGVHAAFWPYNACTVAF